MKTLLWIGTRTPGGRYSWPQESHTIEGYGHVPFHLDQLNILHVKQDLIPDIENFLKRLFSRRKAFKISVALAPIVMKCFEKETRSTRPRR